MMVISILPIASKTAYADESGTPGNPWHIGLDEIRVVTAWLTSDDINKTLHISGTGNMKDFIADDHPWKEDPGFRDQTTDRPRRQKVEEGNLHGGGQPVYHGASL